MTTLNSIRSFGYLLCLIALFSTGCSKKTTTHVYINDSASISEQPVQIASVKYKPIKKYITPTITEPVIEKTNPILITNPEPSQNETIWERLLSLYSLPRIENARIEKEIQRYLKNPEFLTKIQYRAEPYLYFILDEIEAKQLPGELALLPVIESAFKPRAISKSQASGLWQFMPATGRLFGLKQNEWYDDRMDIYSSTKAATRYLKELGSLYDNDWIMALAAYNNGKGNIRKAIRQNRNANLPTDYWSLALRKETADYVPRLLAISKIFANSKKYNITLENIPNKPYFSQVTINSPLDLITAASMAKTSLFDFFTLNPAFKKTNTVPNNPFQLLIPIDRVEHFKKKLALASPTKNTPRKQHKIKAGESLSKIAKQYKTTVIALRKSNQLAGDTIQIGQLLHIPVFFDTFISQPSNPDQFYVVKKGDTFWDIARQFSVRSSDIANWNNISLTEALQPGQRLIIKES